MKFIFADGVVVEHIVSEEFKLQLAQLNYSKTQN